MSKIIKLTKGFDIKLKGSPTPEFQDSASELFAVKPTDFIGFSKPKLLVNVGDKVKAGQPLYYDKSMDSVKFAATVSGEVVEIKRGEKRKLLRIVVKSDGANVCIEHKKHSTSDIANLSADEIKAHLAESGVWPSIVQRPFAVMANPADSPRDIYISGFDSAPLAPNYELLFGGKDVAFTVGIEVLKKLTSGTVNLNVNSQDEIPQAYSKAKGIQINKFSGPHPAGNVGVQIHHLNPVNAGDIVWTLNPSAVIQIGRLFADGVFDTSKIIAITGSEISAPKYVRTNIGAAVEPFLKNNLESENVRVISGNVLSGERISQDDFVGFYAQQVTVIPEGDDFITFGSFVPTMERLSYHRAAGLMSFVNNIIKPSKEYTISSNIQGEHRPFVQTGVFEEVVPMDILPMQLLKAIIAEDYEEMEGLGIYEVAEEDLALCEFVDASKTEVQAILRKGIELLQES